MGICNTNNCLWETKMTSHECQSGAFVDSSDPRLSIQLFDTVHWAVILHLSCRRLDLHTQKHTGVG